MHKCISRNDALRISVQRWTRKSKSQAGLAAALIGARRFGGRRASKNERKNTVFSIFSDIPRFGLRRSGESRGCSESLQKFRNSRGLRFVTKPGTARRRRNDAAARAGIVADISARRKCIGGARENACDTCQKCVLALGKGAFLCLVQCVENE